MVISPVHISNQFWGGHPYKALRRLQHGLADYYLRTSMTQWHSLRKKVMLSSPCIRCRRAGQPWSPCPGWWCWWSPCRRQWFSPPDRCHSGSPPAVAWPALAWRSCQLGYLWVQCTDEFPQVAATHVGMHDWHLTGWLGAITVLPSRYNFSSTSCCPQNLIRYIDQKIQVNF